MASVIIPLYTGLGSDWDEAVTAATNSPEVDFVFIVNPENGVQVDSQASSYIPAIEALPANVKCLGYVYTGVLTTGLRPIDGVAYTDTTGVPASGLEENIGAYVSAGYPLYGIFLDEFDGNFDQSQYANALAPYIHSVGLTYAMANPGDTNVTLNTGMDNWCIYEEGGGGEPTIPTDIGLTASEMSMITYGFGSTFPTAYVQSIASSVALLNIGYGSNPYDTVGQSAYFASAMGQALTGTPQILGGGSSPPPPLPASTTYLSDLTATVDSQTDTTVTITLKAILSTSSGPLAGQSVDFYWTAQPGGSKILAGSGTTGTEGQATAPALALSDVQGSDTYILQAEFPGTSTYSPSTAGISYTPTGGSSPPPPPSGTVDATTITGFTTSFEGTSSAPIILLKGVLEDTVTGASIGGATLEIVENGNFASGTDTTSSDGSFAIAIQGGNPSTTYGIEISYAGSSKYAPCSVSTIVTTPPGPSPPPPPATSSNALAVVGVAAVLTVATVAALVGERVI